MPNTNPIANPPITSYQRIALPLSVAMVNSTSDNWFYSNYIQVMCVNREHYLSAYNRDNALHFDFYNPEITFPEPADHISIEGREQLFFFSKMDFLKRAIDEGWCLYTDADMFYIDGSDSYESYHYTHDMLIYGYDHENLLIYMYDDFKLASHTVSFDHFLKGYFSEEEREDVYRDRTILFKPNEKEFTVQVEKIRWHMHDYLNGTETFARERPNIFNPDSLTVNGIRTYEQFENLLNYVIESDSKELRRSDLYCFYEHKKIMFDRVVTLSEDNILQASHELITDFEEIKKAAQRLLFLGLKVNRVQDPDRQNIALNRMKEIARKIKISEESAWNQYIDTNKELLG
jgi:hypothetical protein